jgi:hypothetical protein
VRLGSWLQFNDLGFDQSSLRSGRASAIRRAAVEVAGFVGSGEAVDDLLLGR